MPQLSLQLLTKTFSRVTAVDRLTLDVADGELLALVGPSGCGKSTTLRMIAGLETPSGGTISIAGQDVTHQSARSRDVAMVFQDLAIYPHLNVADNLAFGLRMRGVPRHEARRRVGETAEMLAIGDLLGRLPRELSGGQRQRVALGRAIVRQPRLFLLDEPLAQLDEPLRNELRGEIRRLHSRFGITTIFVTHDQAEALQLGQRLAVLQVGQLQQLGTPQQIYYNPANRFVAGFFGSPTMNFIHGQLRHRGGKLWFEASSFSLQLPDSLANRLGPAGPDVILSFRADSIRPVRRGFAENEFSSSALESHLDDERPGRFPAKVTGVEWLGDRSLARLSAQNLPLLLVQLGRDQRLTPGDICHFEVAPDSVHVFSAKPPHPRLGGDITAELVTSDVAQ